MHVKPPHFSTYYYPLRATQQPHLSNNMAATLPSILLILSVAFTAAAIAAAHHPPPSNESKLLKTCADAIGPDDSSLATFCARDFLGHRAAFLASCDRRKTVAVVLKEVQMRAKAVADLEKKIISNKSLSAKELQDLKGCWGHLSKVVSSIGNVYANAAVKMPSTNAKVELVGMFDQEAAVKGRCDFSAAGRQSGLWLELQVKLKASLRAELVALKFVDQLYNN